MHVRYLLSFSLLAALPVLAGCSGTNVKEELGLTRRTPDEFAVVERAPLAMPPDFYLHPPTPGAPRPQEQSASDQAATALLGQKTTSASASASENVLLQKTNAAAADPNIRNVIDAETAEIAAKDKPTVQKILDIGGKKNAGPAQVVDAPAEAARLKKNKDAGVPVNEGVTPAIKQ